SKRSGGRYAATGARSDSTHPTRLGTARVAALLAAIGAVAALVVVAGASAWPDGVSPADTVVNLDQNPAVDPSQVAPSATLPVMIDVAGQPAAVAFAHASSHS